ncbi:DUF1015 domain-containing protein [Candidatus Fermentibacterales bacterium]|nr:DUF1015 domain-containing protein [Candidatus Fermentibacterales bacterium]
MAIVRPFRGLRPRRDLAERIASPPYDVLDSDEAREMARDNPLSFLHVVKPEIDLDPGLSLYDDRVYARGAENLRRMISEGAFSQDAKPMFYFYRQIMGRHSQVGLVACVSVDDYENDVIRKHEFTRKEKEEDRIRHITAQNAHCGPVFLTYNDVPELNELQARISGGDPEYDFTAPDGVRHTLWLVESDADIMLVQTLFALQPWLYVADGHHRSASGTIVGQRRRAANPAHRGDEEYNFFLAVLFPKSHMQILPYNRAVEDLAGQGVEEFLKRAGEKFELLDDPPKSPSEPHSFSMYLEGKWIGLRARESSFPADDPVRSIDSSILQQNLLGPVLGIGDPRTDQRIRFIGGIRGTAELERLVDSGKCAVAFSLHPATVDQLMSVADSGQVMPPKSTWFEPKLRSGLVIHLLD